MTRNQRVTAGMSAPPPVHGANRSSEPQSKTRKACTNPLRSISPPRSKLSIKENQ